MRKKRVDQKQGVKHLEYDLTDMALYVSIPPRARELTALSSVVASSY